MGLIIVPHYWVVVRLIFVQYLEQGLADYNQLINISFSVSCSMFHQLANGLREAVVPVLFGFGP